LELNDAVALDVPWFYLPNGHNASTVVLARANQLAGNRFAVHHNYVGKQDDEGFVSNQRSRANNCVSKSKRPLLFNVPEID
jgi:hypothetical protein